MKRAVGLLTIAVMLSAQTVTYAAEQKTQEREMGKQSGQETQRQSGQEMQRESGQSGQAGSGNFSEEMQRQSRQSLQSGQKSQCQRPGQSQPIASQQPAGQQPGQAGREQSQQDLGKQAQGQQTQPPQAGQEQSRQAQSQQSSPGMVSGAATQTLKGQFIRMESEFYVIKDQSGKEVCIPTSYGTFIDQTFVPGDNIVARMSPDGTAAVIGRFAEGQTASAAGSKSQDMNSGMKEQSTTDKDVAKSQAESQGQAMGSGASEQSARGEEKAGTQQNAQLVKGELLKIQGEFYTVKDQSGNEIRLHVNKETKIDGNLTVGDKIEAQRTPSGHALSVKKSEGGTPRIQ